MAREQGDDLGKPAIYTAEIDGEQVERPAYSPEDVANLEARGWVPKSKADRKAAAEASPRRAPAPGENA